MAGESKQMAEPNKTAVPSPVGSLLLRKIGSKVREDFRGCKCPENKCKNANCPCWLELYRCTLKCKCVECDNMFGVRGSDSNIEPGQGGTGLFDLNKLPSSNIEPKQAETSSMAGESTQIAKPNKMAAPSLAGYLLLREIGSKVREDFMGCKCPETKCKNVDCPCSLELYRCTLKCKCVECDNMFGVRGSDSETEPGQGGTGGVSNVPDEAVHTTPSTNIKLKQADDTHSMARELPQVEEQPTQSGDNGLNKLPPSD